MNISANMPFLKVEFFRIVLHAKHKSVILNPNIHGAAHWFENVGSLI